MKHFRIFTKEAVLSITKTRRYETRIGERIKVLEPGVSLEEGLKKSDARYVLIGIPEDIGVRANLGQGGTDSAWVPFLSSFLNVQSNAFFPAENILLLGDYDFGDIQFLLENTIYNHEERIEAYRHAVQVIDEAVEKVIKQIALAGKIPVVIGGGHNNSYPIIRGVAKGLQQSGKISASKINCINLDAHADYKLPEGRHSGNAFRYAEGSGYLHKYSIVGLHENYLPQNVLYDMHHNTDIHYTTFEDIFLREKFNFNQAIAASVNFTADTYTGIEVDLDCIAHTLSSAETPAGITGTDARRYVHFTTQMSKPAYFHVCEGAVQLANGKKSSTTGKLISYLVSDFIKAADES